jgi:hypothetical protein
LNLDKKTEAPKSSETSKKEVIATETIKEEVKKVEPSCCDGNVKDIVLPKNI